MNRHTKHIGARCRESPLRPTEPRLTCDAADTMAVAACEQDGQPSRVGRLLSNNSEPGGLGPRARLVAVPGEVHQPAPWRDVDGLSPTINLVNGRTD